MGFILSKNKNVTEDEQPSNEVPTEAVEYVEKGFKKLEADKECHSLLIQLQS